MKIRRALFVVAVFSCAAAACGGTSEEGGGSSESAGSASEAVKMNDCPPTVPANNTSCTSEGIRCNYPKGFKAVCSFNTWSVTGGKKQ